MKRILVVEDEQAIAFGLRLDLQNEGYAVEVESDGETALERAKEDAFDLILLDVMLPRKDGFEICRDLRRAGCRTPIILLTARAQEAEIVMGLELGADDYVTKPFSPRVLLAAFVRNRGRLLNRSQLLDLAWGPGTFVTDRVVDNHVVSLRRKIEPDPAQPRYLLNVRGLGYRFDA